MIEPTDEMINTYRAERHAYWKALDFDSTDGLSTLEHERRAVRQGLEAAFALAEQHPDGSHRYLSTGCLHGEHDYCASMTGLAGAKRPKTCKFCDAHCVCVCHQNPQG